jgi:hypothetical protein
MTIDEYILAAIALFLGVIFVASKRNLREAERELDRARQQAAEAEAEAKAERVRREHDKSRRLDGAAWFDRWGDRN